MNVTITSYSGGIARVLRISSFQTDQPASVTGQMNWTVSSDAEVAMYIAKGLDNIGIGATDQGRGEVLAGLQELERRGLATPTMTLDDVLMNDKGEALFERPSAV
jgi:hypothetical protein